MLPNKKKLQPKPTPSRLVSFTETTMPGIPAMLGILGLVARIQRCQSRRGRFQLFLGPTCHPFQQPTSSLMRPSSRNIKTR